MARKETEPVTAGSAATPGAAGSAATPGAAGGAATPGATEGTSTARTARLARLARLGRPTQPPKPPASPKPGKPPRPAAPAYWFPLVLFGLLSCIAAPLYRVAGYFAFGLTRTERGGIFIYTGHPFLPGVLFQGGLFRGPLFLPGAPWIVDGSFVLGWYWLEALVGGYLLTLAWYRRQARKTGAQVPGRGYRIAGLVLTAAGLALPLLWVTLARFWQPTLLAALWMQGTVEFIVIAVGLWLVAGHEKRRSLTIIALVYTATALLANVWQPAALLPVVLLPGAVLLLSGIGVLTVRRRAAPA